MANDGDSDIQDQMREWMEAAQRPQPPLSNTELRRVRQLLDEHLKKAWLKKRIYVSLPWIITIVTAVGAGGRWLLNIITGIK